MKTSLNSLTGLKKSLEIELPIKSFEIKKNKVIQEISKNANINGFRKGKAPINVLKQQFSHKINTDASNEMISESLPKALQDAKVSPANQPKLIKIDLQNKEKFIYVVEFEVFPEIKVKPFASLEIEQFSASIKEDDKLKALEELKERATEFKSVKRKSQKGDRLTIDFEGTIDGEPFEGGAQENFDIIIGKGLMIEGFEEGLIGVVANKEKEIEVKAKFPKNYSVKDLSNKQAIFRIKVKEVAKPNSVKIDDNLAKTYGDKDENSMKERVFSQMQKALDERLTQINKGNIFDAILKDNEFAVPEDSVKSEAKILQADMQEKMAQQGMPQNNIPEEVYNEEASRRIKLSLLINKIASDNELILKKEAIEAKIKVIAENYQQDYQNVLKWYKEDKSRMMSVESLVMEEMVVDFIASKAKMKKTVKEFNELMQKQY